MPYSKNQALALCDKLLKDPEVKVKSTLRPGERYWIGDENNYEAATAREGLKTVLQSAEDNGELRGAGKRILDSYLKSAGLHELIVIDEPKKKESEEESSEEISEKEAIKLLLAKELQPKTREYLESFLVQLEKYPALTLKQRTILDRELNFKNLKIRIAKKTDL